MDDSQAGAAASGVQIRQRTYAYTHIGHGDYILVEYKVQNVGASTLNNYHLGLFSDFDVSLVGEFDNCHYRADRKLGYVHSDYTWSGFGGYAGIALLGNTPGTHFTAIDNNGSGGSPFSVANGFSNANKYKSISSGLLDTVAGTSQVNGKNVSMTIGSGPYTLASGDSIQVVFMIGAGYDLQTLLRAVDSASVKYQSIKMITEAGHSIMGTQEIGIQPNPSEGIFWLSGLSESNPQLDVLNSVGQKVPFEYNSEGNNQLKVNASAGIYFLKIKQNDRVISRKIVVQ